MGALIDKKEEDGQTMELIALWHFVKRRWWLMALPAAAALIVTLPLLKNVVSPPVTYAVSMRLTAAAPPGAEITSETTPYEDSAYVPWLASEYVVVNMPHWITSASFASEVSQVLHEENIEISTDDLRPAFQADSFRSILTLYVSWDNEAEIRAMAEAAVKVLQTRNQAYFPQFAAEPVQVVALDDVKVNQAAPPIMVRLNPLIRIMLGAALGVGLAVLAEYLDTALRTRADVEAMGLVVLAEIPRE
jgi:capsular polysaccharide biosynthesis protein